MDRSAHPTPHEELGRFDIRVIVAGSRGFDDYLLFCQGMDDYVKEVLADRPAVFISGKAASGADKMAIDWCKDRGYPWAEFPALWHDLEAPGAVIKERIARGTTYRYNVRAGFVRNIRMSEHGTDLVCWYDGSSTGTGHMRQLMLAKVGPAHVKTILIDTDQQKG